MTRLKLREIGHVKARQHGLYVSDNLRAVEYEQVAACLLVMELLDDDQNDKDLLDSELFWAAALLLEASEGIYQDTLDYVLRWSTLGSKPRLKCFCRQQNKATL